MLVAMFFLLFFADSCICEMSLKLAVMLACHRCLNTDRC